MKQSNQILTELQMQQMSEFVSQAFDFARQNDVQNLRIMLEHGLNANLTNHKGDTLLMLAAYHNCPDCVRLLLDFGADVDRANDKGHTPLAGVCFKGYYEIAKILLQNGANPHAQNAQPSESNTLLSPINTALMFRRKDILQLLLAHSERKLSFWQRAMKFLAFV